MITHSTAITIPKWAGEPLIVEEDGWALVKTYKSSELRWEIGLVDLTHRPKALVFDSGAENLPNVEPTQAAWFQNSFVCCRKPGERLIFGIKGPIGKIWPETYIDMTDAWVLLAIFGAQVDRLMERMVPIDFMKPSVTNPIYAITRSHGIWIHFINPKASNPGYFFACDRSHGQNLVDSLMRNGQNLGLKPIGLSDFDVWLEKSL